MIVDASNKVASRSILLSFAAAAAVLTAFVTERATFARIDSNNNSAEQSIRDTSTLILFEDERMTRTAQLRVLDPTNSKWSREYEASAVALAGVIQDAPKASQAIGESLERVRGADAELQRLEQRALLQAKRGRPQEAMAVLSSSAYREAKASLRAGAYQMLWRGTEEATFRSEAREKQSTAVLALIVLLAAGLFWLLWRRLKAALGRFTNEYSAKEDELRSMATLDPLTGVLNRRSIVEGIREVITSAAASEGNFAVLTLDLDGFKPVNDTFGHAAGDYVLKEVAARLQNICPSSKIARLGGDEFAIVEVCDDRDAPFKIARAIVDSLSAPYPYGGEGLEVDLKVGTSVGIALYPRDGQDPETLLRLSDMALYAAKREGGSTLRFFKPRMRSQMRTLALDPDAPALERRRVERAPSSSGAATVCELFRPEAAGEAAPHHPLDRLLHVVRTHLNMDVAFLSEFTRGERIFRHVQERPKQQTIRVGGSDPLEDSYCQLVVDGRLPELIPDTSLVSAAMALPVTAALPVGAHMSVPIVLGDGRVYGTFCCFSFNADQSLNERDMQMMRTFAQLAADQIDGDVQAADRREKLERIRAMLETDQLTIVYQPIYDIQKRKIEGVECLARFAGSPDRPPNEWFSEAAEVGLGVELEMAAVRMSVQALPYLPSDLYLTVNVSPETVLSGELETVVRSVPDKRIVLEFTEHSVISDYAVLQEALKTLRPFARVAIDDAGAGYASLRHILDLRPDIIKLDISLTTHIENDPSRRALATSLIGFAARTGAKLLAEGIETYSELRALQDLGVEYGQGYYLSRPMPLIKLTQFILGTRAEDPAQGYATERVRRSA